MEKRKIAFIHTSPAAVGPLMQFYAEAAPEGNIGPTIDAALDELGEDVTVAVPALPVNGRTTYQGYHLVHRRLLSDSPMRHHPLTPMTNPGLVELLGRQTRRRVRLAPYAEVEAGVERLEECFRELRREGVRIARGLFERAPLGSDLPPDRGAAAHYGRFRLREVLPRI